MDVVAAVTRGRHVVVRGADVDFVLDDSREGHGERGEDEPPGDTRDGVHGEPSLAEEGVDDLVENGDEDDDDDGVDVLHFVVGHAVELHRSGLRDEVGVELVVDDPVDGIEGEDLAGHEGTAELVDEGFAPGGLVFLAVGGLVGGASGFEGAAIGHGDPEGFEGVGEDGARWGARDVELLPEEEDGETAHEGDETHEVDGPKALIFLHEYGGDETQGADIDTPVEDHVDALEGDTGVLDNALARRQSLDLHLGLGHLLSDQRGDVGFDASRAESNDGHASC